MVESGPTTTRSPHAGAAPALLDPTASDEVFGAWHVASPNPVLLRGVADVKALPEAFAVRDHHLVEALSARRVTEGPRSLAEAAAQGRLFLVDYELLADLPGRSDADMDFFGQVLDESTARQRYLPALFGLFCLCDGQLEPVAIQLGRDPQQFEVFTPADEPRLWAAVKMIYLCADFNLHEMATHLSGVHFILEGVVISTARQLHTNHPVAVQLEHHFRYLLWNNYGGVLIVWDRVFGSFQVEEEEPVYGITRARWRAPRLRRRRSPRGADAGTRWRGQARRHRLGRARASDAEPGAGRRASSSAPRPCPSG